MDEYLTARVVAAGLPAKHQITVLRAIDRVNGDPDADRYLYYTDDSGQLWKGVGDDRVRQAHTIPGDTSREMTRDRAELLYGPLTRVDH